MRRALALTALVLTALPAIAGCGQEQTRSPAPVASASVAMQPSFPALQQQFERVVQTVSPQVVEIQGQRGLGSGVVFDGRGDVVTNAHVVDRERQFAVTLANGDRHPATLVGSDPGHDLAVVHLSGASPAPASFAGSQGLRVGELVLAIGNPLGLRSSVTQGIVSSLNRSVPEGNGVTLSPAIQTSAAINPGNSGGALVDLAGRVIGIPTLAAVDPQLGGGQAAGIGFAIPSSTVLSVATRLIASG